MFCERKRTNCDFTQVWDEILEFKEAFSDIQHVNKDLNMSWISWWQERFCKNLCVLSWLWSVLPPPYTYTTLCCHWWYLLQAWWTLAWRAAPTPSTVWRPPARAWRSAETASPRYSTAAPAPPTTSTPTAVYPSFAPDGTLHSSTTTGLYTLSRSKCMINVFMKPTSSWAEQIEHEFIYISTADNIKNRINLKTMKLLYN